MRVFVNHSSKNSEIVLRFSKFLEDISSEIEVFCPFEKESVKVGAEFCRNYI